MILLLCSGDTDTPLFTSRGGGWMFFFGQVFIFLFEKMINVFFLVKFFFFFLSKLQNYFCYYSSLAEVRILLCYLLLLLYNINLCYYYVIILYDVFIFSAVFFYRKFQNVSVITDRPLFTCCTGEFSVQLYKEFKLKLKI